MAKQIQVWALPALRIEEGETWWLKLIMGFCGFTGLSISIREAILMLQSRKKQAQFSKLRQSDEALA
jgi:hypothetical protein